MVEIDPIDSADRRRIQSFALLADGRRALLLLDYALAAIDPLAGRVLWVRDEDETYPPFPCSLATGLTAPGPERAVVLGIENDETGDCTPFLVDLTTGACVGRATDSSRPACSLVAHPDGQRLVVGHEDGGVAVWDLARSLRSNTWRAHQGPVRHVCVSPHGGYLLSGADGEDVACWDLATSRCLGRSSIGEDGVFELKPSPTEAWLALVVGQEYVRLEALALPSLERCASFPPEYAHGIAAGFHPDGRRLLLSGKRYGANPFGVEQDHDLVAWDLRERRAGQGLSHGDFRNFSAIAAHPDGRRVFTTCDDASRGVECWDLETGRVTTLLRLREPDKGYYVQKLVVTPDGAHLLVVQRHSVQCLPLAAASSV